ncbi:hypothetical protein FJZ48_04605 [Candidatus Uhrbacteria bacterium]|nr:hypothetical protein [Candidatus Uhrbacteria bacterium]
MKGSYAPQWGVTFVKDNPCGDAKEMQNANGVTFCHVSETEGAAGTQLFTDRFATKNGNQYVLVSFEKKAYGGSLCADGFLSSNNKVCVRFNPADYQKMLETIVNTFKYQQ